MVERGIGFGKGFEVTEFGERVDADEDGRASHEQDGVSNSAPFSRFHERSFGSRHLSGGSVPLCLQPMNCNGSRRRNLKFVPPLLIKVHFILVLQ